MGIKNSFKGDKPEKVNNFQYYPATHEFTWNPIEGAVLYSLEISALDAINEEGWEEASATPVTRVEFIPPEGEWKFRVKAYNYGGFSESSDELEVFMYNN